MTQAVSIEDLEKTIGDLAGSVPATPESAKQQPAPVAPAGVRQEGVQVTPSGHLELREFVDVDMLRSDVEFDLNDLDNAIRQQASLFVFYANKARLARRQWEKMKVTVEVLDSRLYAIHREQMTAEGKKATEASIDAAVKTDPRWFAAQQKLIDARAQYDLANDAREAFSQRKDMLIQVSVDRRVERQGDLRINAAQTAAQTTADARQHALDTISGAQKAA